MRIPSLGTTPSFHTNFPLAIPSFDVMATKLPEELELQYIQYTPSQEEQYLPAIRQLISKDLSEPYSIYVYRYFLYQWGDLCYMVSTLPDSHPRHLTNVSLSRPSPQLTPSSA
jgi:hypothetical protein